MEDKECMEKLHKDIFDLYVHIGNACNGHASRAVMAAVMLVAADIGDNQNVSDADLVQLLSEARRNFQQMKEMAKT